MIALTDFIVRMQDKNGNWDTSGKALALVQVRDDDGVDTLKVWSEKASVEGHPLS